MARPSSSPTAVFATPYTRESAGRWRRRLQRRLVYPMHKNAVLRTMVLGFSAMVFLVLSAAYFGYRQSLAIQDTAQDLVREQIVNPDHASALGNRIEEESRELLGELFWLLGSCSVLALGGAALTVWFTNRSFQRMESQTEELNHVSWNLVDSHEKISRRFSHEMHDELGQSLTGLKSMLRRATPHTIEASREEMVGILEGVMRDVRELSQLLRPVILDDFGLDAGLRSLCERFMQRTQIRVDYHSNFNQRLPEQVETHLFRIAQEALTNIARHSGATVATVLLHVVDGLITMTIKDNGRGMANVSQRDTSLGLVGMRARVRQLHGQLKVENIESGGLCVQTLVPFQRPSHGVEEDSHSFGG